MCQTLASTAGRTVVIIRGTEDESDVLGRDTNGSDADLSQCGGAQRMPDKDNFECVIVYENDNDESQLYAHGRDHERDRECALRNGSQRPADRDDNSGGGENEMEEPVMMSDRKGHNGVSTDGTATTLTAQEKERPMIGASVVRRLTPTECSRLQGYPDGWVDIGDWADEKGRIHKESDSAKYRALGNSIALPFWQYLMRRIAAQYEGEITMGSLFDGIGGFPLCALRSGIKPLWSSEIEPFCIAVLKKHFGDADTGEEGDWRKYI